MKNKKRKVYVIQIPGVEGNESFNDRLKRMKRELTCGKKSYYQRFVD